MLCLCCSPPYTTSNKSHHDPAVTVFPCSMLMASQVLLQQHALFTRPQNPNQCSPPIAKLGYVSCFGYRNMPLTSISWSRTPPVIALQLPKHAFVVRADSNPQDTADNDNPDEDAASVSVDELPEAEAEPKPPRKPRVKLGDIMGILHRRAIEASEKERPTPDIRTGDIVEIKLEVPENKRRLSIYKGIVISKQNSGIHTTIRIRRIIAGVGVEIVFPVYSPNIKEIKVVSHRKVRRARLYYLRDKLPRFSTFK